MENVDPSAVRICFFDSGIGGLNLLSKCAFKYGFCDYAYVADNYNVPYGGLPHEKIFALADEKFSFIEKLDPTAAVIACNTVTAECVDRLREKYDFPIIGIQPAVKPAAATGAECLVLATPATARSEKLAALVKEYGRGRARVAACPDLAAYIENNIFSLDENRVAAMLPEAECGAVVLGCTHYIFVSEVISRRYNCPVFDGTDGTVDRIAKIAGIFDHQSDRRGEVAFYGGNCLKNMQIYNFLTSRKGG